MAAAPVEIVGRALRQAHARTGLFASGRTLVVGFSGGQDSTCLLHALAGLRAPRGFHLVAVHVDHALRPESARDAETCERLAGRLDVPARVVRVDVAAYRAGLKRWSVQQAARAARYQALAAEAAALDAAAVLVAHTADDQAETLLLNLARGTGLAGLTGMALDEWVDPRRLGPPLPDLDVRGSILPERLRLVRPLLKVERRTTLAYCQAMGLEVLEDRSNLSRAYTRNRVRLDVLPALEAVNPAVRTTLARAAELAADDLTALDDMARTLHTHLAHPSPDGGSLAYRYADWLRQPRALQRRLIRRGIEELTGGLENVPAAPIEDVLDVIARGTAQQTYHLPRGTEVVTSPTGFRLQLQGPGTSGPPGIL